MPTGGSQRRSVVPSSVSAAGEAVVPRAMDARPDAAGFLVAVLVGSLVIVVVGVIGILVS